MNSLRAAKNMNNKQQIWVVWDNINSGNRTTRAHAADGLSATRTVCGWSIPTITEEAPRRMPRCAVCIDAVAKTNGGK